MANLHSRRGAALRDIDALIEQLAALAPDDWSRSVPCDGWTVRDLAAHLTGTIPLLEGRLAGVLAERHPTPPAAARDKLASSATADALMAALRLAREGLAAQLAAITEDDLERDLAREEGFLAPTIGMYLDLAVFEAAIHRNDVESALRNDDVPVSAEGILAVDAILGTNLVKFAELAQARPDTPLSIVFDGCTIGHTLTWDGRTWSGEPMTDGAVVRVAGSDSALTRFLCGRITTDSSLLTLDGDAEIAARFKSFVPGP